MTGEGGSRNKSALPPGASDALAAFRAPAGTELDNATSNTTNPAAAMDLSEDNDDESRLIRLSAAYEPRYQRFVVRQKSYLQQYSGLYNRRLLQLTAAVEESAKKRWGSSGAKVVDRAVHMGEGERWVAVGTIYKAMQLKPCVLDEYKVERGLSHAAVTPVGNFTSDSDSLLLEDESGRVALTGNIDPHALCTGLVIAVLGVMQRNGELLVEDWCPAGLPPPCTDLPPVTEAAAEGAAAKTASSEAEEDPLVLLVSGLRAGGVQDPLPARLLVDFVAGYLGGAHELALAQRIVRVVICGESVAPPNSSASAALTGRSENGAATRVVAAEQQRAVAAPVAELDRELAQLAAAVATDLMPGPRDPTNFMLPQQPFHPCLLPLSSRLSTLQAVPNPYEAVLGGKLFLGTSGQPIDDVMKYSRRASAEEASSGGAKGRKSGGGETKDAKTVGDAAAAGSSGGEERKEDAEEGTAALETEKETEKEKEKEAPWCLELLEATLRWRHLCPTAPDTLACFPLYEEDPFVLEECPHVYFAGNQPCFATRLVRGDQGQVVRLVCVPSFAATGQAALVNLRTLECTPLTFSVDRGLTKTASEMNIDAAAASSASVLAAAKASGGVDEPVAMEEVE